MKSTNNPFYFDYNATTPLADSVKNWISSGDVPFANPASFHNLGKKSKSLMNDTADYLRKHFAVSKDYEVLFHSGATEGMNTFIRGFAEYFERRGQKIHFFYSGVDHSCTRRSGEWLQEHGHFSSKIQVDKDGQFDEALLISEIKKASGPVLLNFLWCNNETGVVWPLSLAAKIKKETGCFVHVDAAQVPGKTLDYRRLDPSLDVYSYSGHKFGVMKGIGFSFFKESFPFTPLLLGGGQQHDHRSGTENPWTYTLKLALDDLERGLNLAEAIKARDFFMTALADFLGPRGVLIAPRAKERNTQTVTAIFYGKKADETMTILDMNAVQVSSGAACSSGIVRPSPVLMHMGYSEDEAKCGIRFSFSPYWKVSDAEASLSKLTSIFSKILK